MGFVWRLSYHNLQKRRRWDWVREKLGCYAVSVRALVDPRKSCRTETALQNYLNFEWKARTLPHVN